MSDYAWELERSEWILAMESVAGTPQNPVVGLCKHCGAKVYEHQALLSDYNDFCNEDCLTAFEDRLLNKMRVLIEKTAIKRPQQND